LYIFNITHKITIDN